MNLFNRVRIGAASALPLRPDANGQLKSRGRMSDASNAENSRREFLARACCLGGAGILGAGSSLTLAGNLPETNKVRLLHAPAICMAPQYLAQEFLRMEGFTEIEYIAVGTKPGPAVLANGQADFTMWFSPGLIPPMDDGDPIVVLAGVHAGCYELFGNESVNSIRDLKGKTIAVQWFGGGDHIFMASMLAYVGMDPTRDVHWVSGENSLQGAMDMFIDGRADAFLAFDPQPHEMRARNLGKVIVNTTLDRPWSQYFCCMIAANRDYVRRYPVATRHVVRAILKSADICSSDPERAARYLSDYGYETRYPVGLSVMRVLPYDRWRHANPEDTLRFHALRLYEVGMIKTNPNRLIEQGTDWRFLNELKREMKA